MEFTLKLKVFYANQTKSHDEMSDRNFAIWNLFIDTFGEEIKRYSKSSVMSRFFDVFNCHRINAANLDELEQKIKWFIHNVKKNYPKYDISKYNVALKYSKPTRTQTDERTNYAV